MATRSQRNDLEFEYANVVIGYVGYTVHRPIRGKVADDLLFNGRRDEEWKKIKDTRQA